MRYTFVFIFIFICITIEADDYSILHDKIVEYYMQEPLDQTINNIIVKQVESGSYTDLDYQSVEKIYWPPLEHLERLLTISCAYVNPSCAYFGKEELYNHVKRGLQYYYDANPTKPGEYYSDYDKMIAEPHLFGKILLTMRKGIKQLPIDLETAIIERWENQGGVPDKQRSANKTDIAMHRLFLSILKKDEAILTNALYYLFETVEYSEKDEGFQIDNSYTFHGRQFYIGGYSEVVLTNVLTVACWVKDTSFEMDKEKVELLSKFVRETFSGVIRGKVMNYNALGRSISRIDYLYKTDIRCEFMRQMAIIDEEHEDEYNMIAARLRGEKEPGEGVLCRSTHYYRSDYTLHQRPDWSVGIRTVSKRTIRTEVYNNDENIFGYYLPDGSTAITVTGEEYGNIMPLWDWNHIPGVTAPVLPDIPPYEKYMNGVSTFTGGVTDSIYCVTAYDYFDEWSNVDTGAQKGYFLFDKEMICLGAGIMSPYVTHTTIDQCWGDGPVCVLKDDGTKDVVNNYSGDDVIGVIHNSIGYVLPQGGAISVEKEMKNGNWHAINVNMTDSIIKGEVFKLYLNHKVPNEECDREKNTYAYIVVPGVNDDSLQEYLNNRHLEIINTDSIQTVIDLDNDIIEIIFYKPAAFSYGKKKISTSKACVLLMKGISGEYATVHLSDPLRDNKSFVVNFTLNGADNQINVKYPDNTISDGQTKRYVIYTGKKIIDHVSNVEGSRNEEYDMYSLDGKLLKTIKSENERVNLPKGVYIKKGKGAATTLVKKVKI